MRKRAISLLILILAAVMVFSSCTGGATPAKDTLYVGTQLHNGLYNPLYAATVYDEDVCNLIFEGLVTDSPTGLYHVNENMVESFEIAEDKLSCTFKLRDGIKFSNGKPLTASDVVFTYKTLADPSSTAYKHPYAASLKNGEEYMSGKTTEFSGVEALDEKTVVFHFANIERNNLKICSVQIISEAYYPEWEYGDADIYMHDLMKNPLGSGPYKIKELVEGEKIVLEKNKSYWAKDTTDYNIKYVEIKFLKNSEIEAAFENKEIDFVPQITNTDTYRRMSEEQEALGDNANLVFDIFQRNAYGFLGFNTRSGSSSDVAIRQVIAYSFDRKAFVEDYFGDLGEPVVAQIPSSSDIYPLIKDEINPYDYNMESAKSVLSDAGYVLEDGVLTKDNNPVVIKFLMTEDNLTVEDIESRIREGLSELGIELEILPVTFSELLDTIKSEDDDWNMFFMVDDWRGDDPSELTNYFSSHLIPKTNVTRYTNTVVDNFLQQGDMTVDPYSEDAFYHYKEVLLQLNNDLPEIPIYTNKLIAIKDKGVKDISFGTYQRWSEGLDGAYLEK